NYGQGSDDFYANLYTSAPAQHVSLGRFTVSNITELRNVVSKCVSHIDDSVKGTKNSKVLLVADDERNPDFFSDNPSSGWYETVHINNTENYIASIIPRYYYTDKLYSTEYPLEFSAATGMWLKPSALEDLVRRLQSGVNVFCYVGHGAPMQLAHEKLFTPAAFSSVNNYENYFFMIGATCSFGVFNDPELKTLSEQMLISANRGSVGLINSVGPVYSGDNERLTGKIFEAAFSDPVNKLTVGKALKYGKLLHPSYSGNSQSYMLIGDPALSFFNDATIVESESSVELYTLVPDSINSGLNFALEPSLFDDDGIMNTTIYDSEKPRSYFNSIKWDPADDDSLKYVLPGKAVLSVKSTISDGSSTAGFILPKDLTYGENKGRVLFYGYNGSGGEFTGYIDSVSIRGDAQVTITDSIPPSIRILYNSLNYIAGDPVGNDPVIFAEISDEYGINTSGGIGHKIIMEIDGEKNDVTPNFTYDTDNYRKGHTSYQAVELSAGMHNIKVTAWDNFNNYSEKTETFEVTESEGGSSDRIGNLLNYPNPVKGKGTTFGFAVDSQNDLESYSITVYTINGRKIKVIDNCPVSLSANYQQCFWDGRDADGDEPANGVYIYILRAKFQGAGKSVKRGKLIFAR
ncbi:MAG TPA: C25 family cysteine peptidase, partial [Clostridiales bacterium]|nr:C25 family cysteine peptidase [Clostridiales bacterium]